MLLICRVLYDCAAADNYVTVIHYHGLAFGNSALRLVENELQSICVRLGNSCPLLLLMVADACFHTTRFGDSVAVDEVDILGCNIFGEQALVCRKNNSIVLGVNLFNVHRLRQCQTKAFALAYGVMDNALVPAKHVACLVYEVAGLKFSAQACFDKISVGAGLDKADILTVMLLSVDEAISTASTPIFCHASIVGLSL